MTLWQTLRSFGEFFKQLIGTTHCVSMKAFARWLLTVTGSHSTRFGNMTLVFTVQVFLSKGDCLKLSGWRSWPGYHGMVRAGHLSEAKAGSMFSIVTVWEGFILGKVALPSLLAGWQQVVWVLNIISRMILSRETMLLLLTTVNTSFFLFDCDLLVI